jgi:hypothetical protein
MKLSTSAMIAGVGLLMLVIFAPYAELYVYPKLVVFNNAEQTTINIKSNELLFVSMLLSYLATCISDIIVAWALYIYLNPVNKYLSLLAALFRIVYSVVVIVSLLNLVTVYNLTAYADNKMYDQVMFNLNEFRNNFHFGIVFFAIHLLLISCLTLKAKYIPNIMGILLIISGLGYLASSLKPFLFRNVNLDFAVYTFFGELVFMVWLLVKGSRTKEMI